MRNEHRTPAVDQLTKVLTAGNPLLPPLRPEHAAAVAEAWRRQVEFWHIPDDVFDPKSWPFPIELPWPFTGFVPEAGYRGPTINPELFVQLPADRQFWTNPRPSPWVRIVSEMHTRSQLEDYDVRRRGAVMIGGRRPQWIDHIYSTIADERAHRHAQLLVDSWARRVAGEFGTATLTDVESFFAGRLFASIVSTGLLDWPHL